LKNKFSISLSTYVFLVILFSVLGPLFFAKIYIEKQNSDTNYQTFQKERKTLTKNIAFAMIDPITTFSPSEGSKRLKIIKKDKKIVKIVIYDKILEMDFITIYVPERAKGNLFKNHQIIYNEGKEIGWIEMTFSDANVQKELLSVNSIILKILLITFSILILTMYVLLHFKVLRPIKTLTKQAEDFQNNKLDNKFSWLGNDEFNTLGKSFESARVSILKLLKKLSDKNEELEKLYVTDKLTGLDNRHKLDITLDYEESRYTRYNQSFGIILIDIDDFKYVNDTYGHLVGDRVLIEIASILKNNIRKIDILGRWGGEEFLIIVPQSNKKDLLELSKKLKDYIANNDFKLSKHITASFGLSLYEKNLHTLLKNADDALYQVKRNGKNNILFN